MNPTNKPLTVVLGGQRYQLFFDLNTFSAFEKASGKFFLDFLAGLEEAVRGAMSQGGKLEQTAALQLLRKIPIQDLQTFIWAAMHLYDKSDEPYWPLTQGQLGKLVDVNSMATLVPKLLSANAENAPEGESQEEGAARPTKPGTSIPGNGGENFGPSDEDALASLTKTSES